MIAAKWKVMLPSYVRRFVVCIFGLFLFALGNVLGVKAGDAGTNAWNTLAIGLANHFPITFGTSVFLISVAVILIDLLGKGRIGFGTVMNWFLIPVFSDLLINWLQFLPTAKSMVLGAGYTLIGQAIISFATIVYMKAELGCGPRDTLMVLIGRKISRAPIGIVKFIMEILVLFAGFVLGASVGLGTLLVMLLQASLFQLACKVCRFEPRDIHHEDIPDTLKALAS